MHRKFKQTDYLKEMSATVQHGDQVFHYSITCEYEETDDREVRINDEIMMLSQSLGECSEFCNGYDAALVFCLGV